MELTELECQVLRNLDATQTISKDYNQWVSLEESPFSKAWVLPGAKVPRGNTPSSTKEGNCGYFKGE